MISTGAFQTEMDASNIQETLAKKFARVWEKKNSKVARAGGTSLMALSLAACGSDDAAVVETPAVETPATETPATETPVTETPTTPVVATALVGGTDTAGTAGADSFSGVTTGLTSTSSFLATDDIAGGEGADTLSLQLGANFAGFTTTGTDTGSMTGIETVELTSSSTTARSFNATGVSGVETYKIDGSDGGVVSISGSADLAAIDLASIATGAFSVAYAAPTGGTSPVAGTADTLSVSVAGLGSATADISITAAGVETLAITSNAAPTAAGTTNYLNVSGASNATSTTVTGAADTDIAAVSTATTSFDGSTATGAITAVLTNAASSALSSIKTGAGDDKVTATFADLTLTATTDLGEGSDTLVLSGTGGGSSAQPNITGVETLDLSGMTGTATFSMSKSSGITDIVLGDGTGTPTPFAGTITLVSETEARNIDLIGDATGTFSTDTAKAVDIDISADGKATAIALDTSTSNLTADTAATLDVGISGHVDYNGDVSAASATSVTLTTATTAQAFSLVAANAETVNITAGKGLTLDAATNLAAAIDVDVDASGGAFRSTAGTDSFVAVADMDLVGSATTSAATFDNLIGATTLGYDMDITASGLQAGLTLTGGVDSGTGNLSITATDTLGAVDTGNVLSDATFTYNASTLGANTIGTIDALSMVLNASNSVAGITTGTATIGSKATLNGPTTSALDQRVDSDSTSLTVALATGTGDDQIDIRGAATTSTYTVTGDTGRTADDIDITVANFTTDTTSTITVDVSGLTKNTDAADEVVINVNAEATNDAVVIKGSTDTDDELAFGTSYNGVTNTVEYTITNIDTVTFTTAVTLTAGSLSGVTTTLVGNATSDNVILTGTASGEIVTYANVTNNQAAAVDFAVSMGDGADTVTGTGGHDTINGEGGDDTITAGEGTDIITGGAGDDTIVLTETTSLVDTVFMTTLATNGTDTISGFVSATDRIDIDGTGTAYTAGATAQTAFSDGASGSKSDGQAASYGGGQANASGSGVVRITDEANATFSDVHSVITGAMTLSGTASNNAKLAILVDNGTDTRIYDFTDTTDGVLAADFTHIATVSGLEVADFAVADF